MAGTRMSSSDRRVRVGIVGCGNIARRYAETIRGYPETELVGVMDVEPKKAETLARENSC